MAPPPTYHTITLSDAELTLLDACATERAVHLPTREAIDVRAQWQWPRTSPKGLDRLFTAAWCVIATHHRITLASVAPHPDGLPFILAQYVAEHRAPTFRERLQEVQTGPRSRNEEPLRPSPSRSTFTPIIYGGRCSGNCSRGGDGPACGLPGCQG